MASTASSTRVSLPTEWRDFFALTKPRVMTLVIFTAVCGVLAAPGSVHPVLAFTAILAIAMGAGGSAALNHWWEADLDAGMKRTRNRPLPGGRMRREDARDFGIFLSAVSVCLMGVAIGWLAAALLLAAIIYYAVIYTMWLKPRTPQNIVIGGGAGAFPPLIGWVVVTGEITAMPILLFAIIFFWTPPHFWALALFVALALPVARRRRGQADRMLPEKRLFKFSIVYLFVLFAALVADRLAAYQGWLA